MFFSDASEIKNIASKTGCAVFVVPDNLALEIKNAIEVKPTDKSIISMDDIRDLLARLGKKQKNDLFIIIRPADLLGLDSANAMLKNLEEPQDNVHFVLITSKASKIIPTILSRSAVYILREDKPVDGAIDADTKIMDLAKRLVVAKPADLPAIAEEIAKVKDGVRNHALDVLGTAIEILYKSYFKTGKDIFVKKLPKFIAAYENIEKNGHVKLHLVADLC